MLSDVLGVLVAFVSVVLLLSVIVTGLVQATQSVLRIRGRNLLTSVARFLEATNRVPTSSRAERRRVAATILNSGNIAVTDRRLSANPANTFVREVLGPNVSWVHARELAAAIKIVVPTDAERQEQEAREKSAAAADAPPEGPADARAAAVARAATTNMPPPAPRKDFLVEEIKRAEPAWCKRFQFFMRLITIGWSLIIAIGFQVSAPALFSSLSRNPAQAQDILEQQGEISAIAERAIAADQYDLVADAALEELAKKFPDHEDDILQAGNAAATREELIQQLTDVLPEVPERQEIIAAYSKLIDEQVRKAAASNPAGDAANQLEAFGITWWKHGTAFYIDDAGQWRGRVIIGVLLTAILLTFGAPFWFEQLRNLAALRDPRAAAAAKASEREKAGAGSSDENDRADEQGTRGADAAGHGAG